MDEPAREELDRRGVSSREFDVLEAVAERMTNAEIAARLCVSERTVESHVSSLLRKLGVRNRVELAEWVPRADRGRVLGDRYPYQLDATASKGVCVGRDDELQRLLACWDRAEARTTVAVVRGEAGIGKSRLAAAVAAEVHRRGGGVALGTCSDGPQRPYEPFMIAIEADLARLSDEELQRRVGTQGGTFARVSPDVAARLDVAGQDVVDPERERAAVQGALLDYLARAASMRRLLFVVEDLHWATAGTRDAIAHIARTGGDAPLMLLVTTRDAPPYVEAGFGAFLGRLAGVPSVEMIAMAGLDVSAAASLIEAVGGDLDPQQGVSLTGGNPLFLRELAREGPGSRTLGEMVSDRFDRLDPGDLDVVDVAAVAGDQIDVTLIASALDRSTADVLDSLERTESAGLVGPGAAPGRLAFTHDVFRSVRYASLTTSRRLRLHAAIAHALSARAAGEKVSGELARHACLAGPRFDPAVAADLARRAGDAAADATDHGEAATHYRRALEVARHRARTPTTAPVCSCRSALVPRSSSSVTPTDRRCCAQQPKLRFGREMPSPWRRPSARWRRCREGPPRTIAGIDCSGRWLEPRSRCFRRARSHGGSGSSRSSACSCGSPMNPVVVPRWSDPPCVPLADSATR